VLWKKHDPLTQVCFLEVVKEGKVIANRFNTVWVIITHAYASFTTAGAAI